MANASAETTSSGLIYQMSGKYAHLRIEDCARCELMGRERGIDERKSVGGGWAVACVRMCVGSGSPTVFSIGPTYGEEILRARLIWFLRESGGAGEVERGAPLSMEWGTFAKIGRDREVRGSVCACVCVGMIKWKFLY